MKFSNFNCFRRNVLINFCPIIPRRTQLNFSLSLKNQIRKQPRDIEKFKNNINAAATAVVNYHIFEGLITYSTFNKRVVEQRFKKLDLICIRQRRSNHFSLTLRIKFSNHVRFDSRPFEFRISLREILQRPKAKLYSKKRSKLKTYFSSSFLL